MYLKLMKKNQKITTCNRLDLEALGFWPIMLKISLDTGPNVQNKYRRLGDKQARHKSNQKFEQIVTCGHYSITWNLCKIWFFIGKISISTP